MNSSPTAADQEINETDQQTELGDAADEAAGRANTPARFAGVHPPLAAAQGIAHLPFRASFS
ncbi:MAG: hypothetical protein ACR2JJ_07525 [Sphingomicrobium sp.]